jgi:hypothetical protein
MHFKGFFIAASVIVFSTMAHAQVVPTGNGNTTLAVVGDCSQGGLANGASCISPNRGIPLDYYATSANVANQGNQIGALYQKLNQSNSFVAAVGAMHEAIPDPGDRFAVKLNSASVNGVAAGGISASANLGDGFRASINYAGAKGYGAVSGGLNFSIH